MTWLLASVSVGFVYGWVGHWLCAIEKKNVQLIWNRDVGMIGGRVLPDVDEVYSDTSVVCGSGMRSTLGVVDEW